MSLLVDIANAVVLEVSEIPLDPPLVANRRYNTQADVSELASTIILVVPRGPVVTGLVTRTVNWTDVTVDLSIQRKLDPTDLTQVDLMLDMVEAASDHFIGRTLTVGSEAATWQRTEQDQTYVEEHLDQFQVFTSVLSMTFRVLR